MKYNLYYNYQKINSYPLIQEEVNKIKNQQYIYKNINGVNIRIPVSKLKFISCIVL